MKNLGIVVVSLLMGTFAVQAIAQQQLIVNPFVEQDMQFLSFQLSWLKRKFVSSLQR